PDPPDPSSYISLEISRTFTTPRAQTPQARISWPGAFCDEIPAMTDFRALGTIMGPAGLTAVFGMGTGVAPPVWSAGKGRGGGQARPGAGPGGFGHAGLKARGQVVQGGAVWARGTFRGIPPRRGAPADRRGPSRPSREWETCVW